MTPTTNPALAVLYVRASRDSQELTLEAQEQAAREWCAANDVEIVSVSVDAGVSGKASLDQRPGLIELRHVGKVGDRLAAAGADLLDNRLRWAV